MTMNAGPYLPKAGWQKRWLVQALQLAGRAPAALAVLIAGAILLGGLTIGMALLLVRPNTPAIAIQAIMSVTAICALPLRLFIGNLLLRADARGWRSPSDIMDSSRSVLPVVVGMEVAMLAVSALLGSLNAASAGTGTAPSISAIEAALGLGVAALCSLEMTMWVWSVLWVGALPALHVGTGEAYAMDSALRQKSVRFWLALMAIQFFVRSFVLALPTLLGLGLLFVSFAWIYVAAREVLGGIDDNGIEEVAAVPQAS